MRYLVTCDNVYAVISEQMSGGFQVTLPPCGTLVLHTWILEICESEKEVDTLAVHFSNCYGIALEEGFSLRISPSLGPYFTNEGDVKVLIANALDPSEIPPERFRAFVQGIKPLHHA